MVRIQKEGGAIEIRLRRMPFDNQRNAMLSKELDGE
jgi:hypothetical protein